MLASLRGPASAVRDETRRYKQVREQSEAARQEGLRVMEQVKSALGRQVEGDFAAALEQAGERVSQLRRRVQVEERLDQLTRHRRELEDQSQWLFERQPPSLWILTGLGVLFVSGVVLILTGLLGGSLFGLSGAVGWMLSLLGLGGAIASVVTKVVLERSAARQLESCHRQIQMLELQGRQANGGAPSTRPGDSPAVSRWKAA